MSYKACRSILSHGWNSSWVCAVTRPEGQLMTLSTALEAFWLAGLYIELSVAGLDTATVNAPFHKNIPKFKSKLCPCLLPF